MERTTPVFNIPMQQDLSLLQNTTTKPVPPTTKDTLSRSTSCFDKIWRYLRNVFKAIFCCGTEQQTKTIPTSAPSSPEPAMRKITPQYIVKQPKIEPRQNPISLTTTTSPSTNPQVELDRKQILSSLMTIKKAWVSRLLYTDASFFAMQNVELEKLPLFLHNSIFMFLRLTELRLGYKELVDDKDAIISGSAQQITRHNIICSTFTSNQAEVGFTFIIKQLETTPDLKNFTSYSNEELYDVLAMPWFNKAKTEIPEFFTNREF